MKKHDNRKAALAQIHIAKKQLGLDDDIYRDLLESWTSSGEKSGKRSAADLNAKECGIVLDQLRKLGFKGKPRQQVARYPGTPQNIDMTPMLQKIEAQLADMQLPWSYANAIAARQFGIERVGWLKRREHFEAVIAALHVEQEKRSLWAGVEREMLRLSITEADIERDYRPRKGWKRNRKALEQLLSLLSQKEVVVCHARDL